MNNDLIEVLNRIEKLSIKVGELSNKIDLDKKQFNEYKKVSDETLESLKIFSGQIDERIKPLEESKKKRDKEQETSYWEYIFVLIIAPIFILYMFYKFWYLNIIKK